VALSQGRGFSRYHPVWQP